MLLASASIHRRTWSATTRSATRLKYRNGRLPHEFMMEPIERHQNQTAGARYARRLIQRGYPQAARRGRHGRVLWVMMGSIQGGVSL